MSEQLMPNKKQIEKKPNDETTMGAKQDLP